MKEADIDRDIIAIATAPILEIDIPDAEHIEKKDQPGKLLQRRLRPKTNRRTFIPSIEREIFIMWSTEQYIDTAYLNIAVQDAVVSLDYLHDSRSIAPTTEKTT
jgi:hypothetical protein